MYLDKIYKYKIIFCRFLYYEEIFGEIISGHFFKAFQITTEDNVSLPLSLSLSLSLDFDKCCPFVPTNESDYKPNIENSSTIGRTGVGTPLKGSGLSKWD